MKFLNESLKQGQIRTFFMWNLFKNTFSKANFEHKMHFIADKVSQSKFWKWVSFYSKLFKIELLLFIRVPIAIIFSIFIPLFIMLIYHVIFARNDMSNVNNAFTPTNINQVVPLALGISCFMNGIISIAIVLATRKTNQFYIRYRLSGLTLSNAIISQVGVFYSISIIFTIIGLTIGGLICKITIPDSLSCFYLFLSYTVGSLTAIMLGVLIGSLAKTERSAVVFSVLVYFVLNFIGGGSVPLNFFPVWIQTVAKFLPYFNAVNLYSYFWVGAYTVYPGFSIGILLGEMIIFSSLALRAFAW